MAAVSSSSSSVKRKSDALAVGGDGEKKLKQTESLPTLLRGITTPLMILT
jgi:hypothetical protein